MQPSTSDAGNGKKRGSVTWNLPTEPTIPEHMEDINEGQYLRPTIHMGPMAQQRRKSTIYTSSDSKLIPSNKSRQISEVLVFLAYALALLIFPISIFFCLRVVKEYERAVVFRLGRVRGGRCVGPGLIYTLPCIDSVRKVDLRVVSFDVPPQEILSKDSVTVSVDAVVYFRVNDPVVSVTNVSDFFYSTKLLAQTTLRNILGTKTLGDMLQERDHISQMMETILHDATLDWGIKVERVEMKDIRLPGQLMRAMAAEAEAAREAKAKIVAAEGEYRASRPLAAAADSLGQSETAFQLRYLQTLNTIASEHRSTVLFPVPMDFTALFGATELAHQLVDRPDTHRPAGSDEQITPV